MKKILKKLTLVCILLLTAILVFGSSRASVINLDYNNKEELKSKDVKVYAGDEIYVIVSLNDEMNTDGKVMALYGKIDYDKDVLELVEAGEGINNNNPKIGKGWLAGSVNDKDNTFFFYTTDDERSSTVGFIKFKVKTDVDKFITTKFIAKDVTAYKMVNESNYEEIPAGAQDVELEIKISKNIGIFVMIFMFVAVVILIVLLVIVIRFVIMKKFEKNKSSEDVKIIEESNNDSKVEQENKEKKSVKEEKKKENKKTKEDIKEAEIIETVSDNEEESSEEESKENNNLKKGIEANLEKLALAKEKFEKMTTKVEEDKEEKIETSEEEETKDNKIESEEEETDNKEEKNATEEKKSKKSSSSKKSTKSSTKSTTKKSSKTKKE